MKHSHCLLTVAAFIIVLTSNKAWADAPVQTQKLLRQIGECNSAILGNFIDIEKNRAYITTQKGLDVIDISNPRRPEKIGSIEFGSVFEIEAFNDFVYMQSGSILIVDTSCSGKYSINGRYSTGTRYSAMKGRDNYLFVACVNSGLEILDISNPIKPVRHSKFEDSGYHIRLALKDDILYLADSESGIEIIDISDLSAPSKISTLQGTKSVCGLAIENEVLMVGTPKGVLFYDISTPDSPVQMASMTEFVLPRKMTAKDNILFFLEGDEKVMIVDYSVLQSPATCGSLKEITHDLFFDGNHLFSVSISPSQKLSIFKFYKE